MSTLNWAVYTVLGHGTLRKLGAVRATAGAMILGWLMLAPLFLAQQGWREFGHVSATGSGSLVFLGVGCSGLGYLFWYGGLEHLEASSVASFLYLEPLVTLAAAALVLGASGPARSPSSVTSSSWPEYGWFRRRSGQ